MLHALKLGFPPQLREQRFLKYHEKIWSLFQRLEARDKVVGTGIGLSVIKTRRQPRRTGVGRIRD